MKHILEFSLPEDQNDLTLATNAQKYFLVLWDLDQHLRNAIKYEQKEEYQPIREKLYELMGSHYVDLDEVE